MSTTSTVPSIPLIVDLDGTLLRSDLLHESVLELARGTPHLMFLLPFWLAKGKAKLKQELARRVRLDIAALPFDSRVLDWIETQRSAGRKVVLCTASDEKLAHQVAQHLGVFDDVMASNGVVNLSRDQKRAALVERYGAEGYDYAGNSSADLPVWSAARRAIVVGPARLRRIARARFAVEHEFATSAGGIRAWFKTLRVHQWVKNLLIFLPLLGAHRLFDAASLLQASIAFVAFSLCASSVYVVNDLIDLESDRRHPRKKNRPLAAGIVSPIAASLAVVAIAATAGVFALRVNLVFASWLAAYFALTVAYTFWLKRKVVFDAITLACLYSLRVLAGGAAVGLAPSSWLLAFCLFLFLSLAFVKRFSELQTLLAQNRKATDTRDYRTSDLVLVEMMGVASGFIAVMVLALYINGDSVLKLYRYPSIMWLTVPIFLYFVCRMWVKAHRGEMHDDPVVYAFRDRVSLIAGSLFLVVMWGAA